MIIPGIIICLVFVLSACEDRNQFSDRTLDLKSLRVLVEGFSESRSFVEGVLTDQKLAASMNSADRRLISKYASQLNSKSSYQLADRTQRQKVDAAMGELSKLTITSLESIETKLEGRLYSKSDLATVLGEFIEKEMKASYDEAATKAGKAKGFPDFTWLCCTCAGVCTMQVILSGIEGGHDRYILYVGCLLGCVNSPY